MGVILGMIVIMIPILTIGAVVYRILKPGTSMYDVHKAKGAINKIYEATNKYTGGLDTVGQAMCDEINTIVTNYWKDVFK